MRRRRNPLCFGRKTGGRKGAPSELSRLAATSLQLHRETLLLGAPASGETWRRAIERCFSGLLNRSRRPTLLTHSSSRGGAYADSFPSAHHCRPRAGARSRVQQARRERASRHGGAAGGKPRSSGRIWNHDHFRREGSPGAGGAAAALELANSLCRRTPCAQKCTVSLMRCSRALATASARVRAPSLRSRDSMWNLTVWSEIPS
jgi:hypothetical protein